MSEGGNVLINGDLVEELFQERLSNDFDARDAAAICVSARPRFAPKFVLEDAGTRVEI